MDDEHEVKLFRPSVEEMYSTWHDLETGLNYGKFESELLGLCRRVGSDKVGSDTDGDYDPSLGVAILALALIAAEDLAPRRGRWVSAKHVGLRDDGYEPWFYVVRRTVPTGGLPLTRLRIWVPPTTEEAWLASFDENDVLRVLEQDD